MLNGRGYPDTVNDRACCPPRPTRPQPAVAARQQPGRGQTRPARAAAHLEPERHALLHAGLDDPDEGRRAQRAAASRPVGHRTSTTRRTPSRSAAASRSTSSSTPRASAPGTYLLYTTNLNYLSNDARGLRRNDDRDPRCSNRRSGADADVHSFVCLNVERDMSRRISCALFQSPCWPSRRPGVAAGRRGRGARASAAPRSSLTAKADRISTPEGGSFLFWGFAAERRTPAVSRAHAHRRTRESHGLDHGGQPAARERRSARVAGASRADPAWPRRARAGSVRPGADRDGGGDGWLGDLHLHARRGPAPSSTTAPRGPTCRSRWDSLGAMIVRPATPARRHAPPRPTRTPESRVRPGVPVPAVRDRLARSTTSSSSRASRRVDASGRLANHFPNYWFINGRNAPDTMAEAGTAAAADAALQRACPAPIPATAC